MPSLSGFGSLAAIPEEKITDKITRYLRTAPRGFFCRQRADLTARKKLAASRFASAVGRLLT